MKEPKPKYRIKPIICQYSNGSGNYLKFIIQKRWLYWWFDYSQPTIEETNTKKHCEILNFYYLCNKANKLMYDET